MDDRIADDARFALLAKVRQARMLSPQMKFQAGSDLFDEACQWTLAGISASHPHASQSEKLEKLRRRLELMELQSR
jgi:hypothetical protein